MTLTQRAAIQALRQVSRDMDLACEGDYTKFTQETYEVWQKKGARALEICREQGCTDEMINDLSIL